MTAGEMMVAIFNDIGNKTIITDALDEYTNKDSYKADVTAVGLIQTEHDKLMSIPTAQENADAVFDTDVGC